MVTSTTRRSMTHFMSIHAEQSGGQQKCQSVYPSAGASPMAASESPIALKHSLRFSRPPRYFGNADPPAGRTGAQNGNTVASKMHAPAGIESAAWPIALHPAAIAHDTTLSAMPFVCKSPPTPRRFSETGHDCHRGCRDAPLCVSCDTVFAFRPHLMWRSWC